MPLPGQIHILLEAFSILFVACEQPLHYGIVVQCFADFVDSPVQVTRPAQVLNCFIKTWEKKPEFSWYDPVPPGLVLERFGVRIEEMTREQRSPEGATFIAEVPQLSAEKNQVQAKAPPDPGPPVRTWCNRPAW